MNRLNRFILLLTVLLALLASFSLPLTASAELDDSSLFMEAFSAFQGKDYLHSIDKLKQLDQLFPDSPLRDVSLLLQARSLFRSGDNDSAGLVINQFQKEFGTSSLSHSVEHDLLGLGKRKQAGEKLLPNKHLRMAAQKVRNEQLAIEQAAAMKAEQERLARERAERERIAREKAEAERRELARLAAIKAARDAVQFDIEPVDTAPVLESGSLVAVPFVFTNKGKDAEEFSFEHLLPAGIEGMVTTASDRTQPLQKLTVQPGQKVDLLVAFRMPADRVDGAHLTLTAKVASTKFTDIIKSRELSVIAAAPLLRAVSRLQQSVSAGGAAVNGYKVTLLNVGSIAAREVELRIHLPQQLKVVDAGGNGCWVESDTVTACRIDTLKPGQLTERVLNVEARSATGGKAVRGVVEVLQTRLQVKESFNGAAFMLK